ncbi:MAG: amidohydrolase family protein [Deltaproteobacteria bacterium]|nr:amidohydrolase family protein [Deltaproteobacteria bacterium]
MIKVLPPYSREEIRAAIEETHYYRRLITVHSGHSALMRGQYYDFVRWAVEEGADCIEHAFAIPDDVIATMAKKKTYCVPTLDMMLKIADKVIAANPDNRARAQQRLDSSDIFRKMKKLGVRMAVGTDAVREDMVHYPWMYFEEIERFVDHGYTEMEAIVAATRIAAEVSGVSDKLGTLQKGKIADLVVVEGNPLDDIRHLRKAKVIVQSGRIVKQ